MNHQSFRMDFKTTLPYEGTTSNVALPVNKTTLANATNGKVTLDDQHNLVIDKNMYQDDIISVFEKAWRTRPNTDRDGHVDHDVHVMMKALIFTFENAAWVKHGYSGSDHTESIDNMKRGLGSAPTVQEVTDVFTRVLDSLRSRN